MPEETTPPEAPEEKNSVNISVGEVSEEDSAKIGKISVKLVVLDKKRREIIDEMDNDIADIKADFAKKAQEKIERKQVKARAKLEAIDEEMKKLSEEKDSMQVDVTFEEV